MKDFIIVNNLAVRACAVIGVTSEQKTIYVKFIDEPSLLVHECTSIRDALDTLEKLTQALNDYHEKKSDEALGRIKDTILNIVGKPEKEEECTH